MQNMTINKIKNPQKLKTMKVSQANLYVLNQIKYMNGFSNLKQVISLLLDKKKE